MKFKKSLFLAGLVLCLFMVSCGPADTAPSRVTAVRIFDIFEEDDIVGKVTLDDAGFAPVQWWATNMIPWIVTREVPPLGIRALNDLGGIQRSGQALIGKITGDAPVLQFALKENRGGADPIKFIEVRMKVTGASQVWLRAQGGREVNDSSLIKWAGSTDWNISADMASDAVQTYRFELAPGRGAGRGAPAPPAGTGPPRPRGGPPLPGGGPPRPGGGPPLPGGGPPRPGGGPGLPGGGPPPPGVGPALPGGMPRPANAPGDLRNFFLTFRDCQDASFSIESIRFISQKEANLNQPSGQQWAGLSEVYRETLVAKSSETIRVPLRELPERPWLDVAIGTTEEEPVTFVVSMAQRQGSELSEPEVLLQRTLTTPGRWEPLRVDLADYAGKSAVLELSLKGGRKGLWGYWGAPVIRASFAAEPRSAANASAGQKPRGVIFLVVDTLRADHLNIYGYERETLVHLKKFTEEGVAFRNAIAESTWTKVSQPSMITSLHPISHGVLDFTHGLPASADTIAEVYREAGYATVSYSSIMFTGKMNNMHQGYEELHERNSLDLDLFGEYSTKTTRSYVDRLIPWLEHHKDVPFFVFLHVFDPHSPFRPRPPYDTLWAKPEDKERLAQIDDDIRKFKVKNEHGLPVKADYAAKTDNDPDELLRIYKDYYDGSIRGMDAEIGRLFQALQDLGLDDDTLIVFSSDHGEEFWEHGRLFHGQSVYGELSHVPLVFRWPNNPAIRKGAMVDQIVENVDIMPTLLELSGIPGPAMMQGRSLVPLLEGSGEVSWPDRLIVTHTLIDNKQDDHQNGHHFGFIDDGMKVVRKEINPSMVEELYDRATDPLDRKNLINGENQRARAGTLTQTFTDWRTRMQALKLPSDEEAAKELTSDELRRLQALGYVGGGVQPKKDDPVPDQESDQDK